MAAIFAMATEPVDAYYDDTHYSLTYFIARSCGYTPLQAYRIASANLSVDYSDITEPVQRAKVEDLAETAQDAREQFHAIWDYRIPTSRTLQQAAWRGRELKWQQLAKDQINPGVLLHYVQDEDPHTNYSSWGGHWVPSPQDVMSPPVDPDVPGKPLPFGPMNDFLSYNQQRSLRMVDKTMETLAAFMRSTSRRQRPGIACNRAAVFPVLSALVLVNDVHKSAVHEPAHEYARRVQALMDEMRKLNITDAQMRVLSQLATGARELVPTSLVPTSTAGKVAAILANPVAAGTAAVLAATPLGQKAKAVADVRNAAEAAAPNVDPADRAVAGFLAGQIPPYEPSNRRERYTYNAAGRNPMSDLPPFAVYGNLRTNVRGIAGRTVEVSVWAAPTRPGEQPYQLDCKSGSEVTSFENLPVGDLIVQTSVDGKVTKHPKFTFEARPLQFTNVNVSPAEKKEEKQSECRKQVAKKSEVACQSFLDGKSSANFDQAQSQRLQADFEKELEDCDKKEEEQKRTDDAAQQQAPQQTPTRGGGVGTAVKAGVTIVAATVGGLYLKSELDKIEELYPTTTTTTTTNTPPTATPVSAGTMTYLSGTFQCTFNAGGILNLCNNSNIRVNITVRMPVGTTLRLTASGAVSSSLPQTRTDPPGEVIFQNFNGFGNPGTCPAPIRQLLLFNVANPNTVIATASVSIPVTCR